MNNHGEPHIDSLGRPIPKGFGGLVPGSGRKSKAAEFGLAKLLEDCWTYEQRKEVITKLHEYALAGGKSAVSAAQLLLAYAYGKPREHVKVEVVDPKKVATDTLNDLQNDYHLPLDQAAAIVRETFGDVLERDTVA